MGLQVTSLPILRQYNVLAEDNNSYIFSSEFLGTGVAKDICINETNQSQCSTYFCFGSSFQLLNPKKFLLLIISK